MYRAVSYCLLLLSLGVAVPARAQFAAEGQGLLGYALDYGGQTRSYAVYVPTRVRQEHARVPLVIVLHGGGGNGQNVAMMTGFTAKAERENFIVAYPNGSGRLGNILLTWNAGHCCAYAMRRHIDDVGFIRAMISQIVRDLPVDPRRVYATGVSNGAMMSHRLGIELSEKIAAIAPVAGSLFGDEGRPSLPVPALFINGALDEHIRPSGGGSPAGFPNPGDGSLPRPVAYQGLFWATVNGCNLRPREQAPSGGQPVAVWRYPCPPGREVVRYLVMDNGHAWPGGRPVRRRGDIPSQALNATDVIWDFFKTHSR